MLHLSWTRSVNVSTKQKQISSAFNLSEGGCQWFTTLRFFKRKRLKFSTPQFRWPAKLLETPAMLSTEVVPTMEIMSTATSQRELRTTNTWSKPPTSGAESVDKFHREKWAEKPTKKGLYRVCDIWWQPFPETNTSENWMWLFSGSFSMPWKNMAYVLFAWTETCDINQSAMIWCVFLNSKSDPPLLSYPHDQAGKEKGRGKAQHLICFGFPNIHKIPQICD